MLIESIIDLVDDGKPCERGVWGSSVIAIHRIWFDDWPLDHDATAISICRRFIDDPEIAQYTGGELPYGLLVDEKGKIYQALPLSDVGKHARIWNVVALGVGVIGDFRVRPPTPLQRAALVDLCAELCPAFGIDPLGESEWRGFKVPNLAGHDELPYGSRSSAKRCPGEFIPMDKLRQDVATLRTEEAQRNLLYSGLTL